MAAVCRDKMPMDGCVAGQQARISVAGPFPAQPHAHWKARGGWAATKPGALMIRNMSITGRAAMDRDPVVTGEADPVSIRGAYGRITTKGVYENVIHTSANETDAEREIKLWFEPDDIIFDIYPTKEIKLPSFKKRAWSQ